MNLKINLANKSNYGSKRNLSEIKYIVIHYTANDGDTDESNGKYFKNNVVKASAHYFVDSDSITQSVPDDYVAYSVGGNKWNDCSVTGGGKFYGVCKNQNSISIELTDDVKDGVIYPSKATIDLAIDLTKILMKKYLIDNNHVIRHFDVNGKHCPMYWCCTEEKDKKWQSEFLNNLDNKEDEVISYKVRVTANVLNVRLMPTVSSKIATSIKKNEVYTIVEEKDGWGKLKSGAGWISLKYTTKV